MIFPSKADITVVGASVTGQAHSVRDLPNQDSLLGKIYGYGSVLAVADGVGSEKFSQYGSRSAVRAVQEVFCAYVRGDISRRSITSSISEAYRNSLNDRYRDQAATTCIFAAHIYNEGLYLGQIGDGMLCGHIDGSPFTLSSNEGHDFTNLVHPLSCRNLHPIWKTKFFAEKSFRDVQLMLASDGISEDILPGCEHKFMNYLLSELSDIGKGYERTHWLEAQLQNWATPKSLDDKTVLLYQYKPHIGK